MSPLFFIPLVYLAALVQTRWATHWDALEAGPNLLVLAAFLWLTQSSSRWGLLMAAFAGLVADLNSTTPLGLNMATFSCAAYAVVLLRRQMSLDGFVAQLGVVWFAAVSVTLCQGIFIKFTGAAPIGWNVVAQSSALAGLYTMIVGIPLLTFIFRRRSPREQFA